MATRISLDGEGGTKYALIKDPHELNAGDRRAVRGAVDVKSDGESMIYPGDHDDLQKNALLTRIILEWNVDFPVPSKDPTVLDKLDIATIDRLYDAVQPHIDHFSKNVANPNQPGTDPTVGSSS